MQDDDPKSPRNMSRRRAIRLLGLGGAALYAAKVASVHAAGAETEPMCVERPRHIEGPYFIDIGLKRSDIRSDPRTKVVREGVPLRLTFRVSDFHRGRCLPLAGAQVDVWHCDAAGLYSDTEDWQKATLGQRFLRGYQLTDRKGHASFTTIYPGWYPNRAVHIHFKIRTHPKVGTGKEFTSQIYFEDKVTDEVHTREPYAKRGPRKVRNNRDLIYLFRGSQLMLDVREEKKGYAGIFDIALDLS